MKQTKKDTNSPVTIHSEKDVNYDFTNLMMQPKKKLTTWKDRLNDSTQNSTAMTGKQAYREVVKFIQNELDIQSKENLEFTDGLLKAQIDSDKENLKLKLKQWIKENKYGLHFDKGGRLEDVISSPKLSAFIKEL